MKKNIKDITILEFAFFFIAIVVIPRYKIFGMFGMYSSILLFFTSCLYFSFRSGIKVKYVLNNTKNNLKKYPSFLFKEGWPLLLLFIILVMMTFVQKLGYYDFKNHFIEIYGRFKDIDSLGVSKPIIYYIVAIIIGPILEEIYFRFYLFNKLKYNMNIYIAMIIVSFFGSVGHRTGPYIGHFIIFLAINYFYHKFDNLLVPISIHMLTNSSVLLIYSFFR